jgi:hypothetical protein
MRTPLVVREGNGARRRQSLCLRKYFGPATRRPALCGRRDERRRPLCRRSVTPRRSSTSPPLPFDNRKSQLVGSRRVRRRCPCEAHSLWCSTLQCGKSQTETHRRRGRWTRFNARVRQTSPRKCGRLQDQRLRTRLVHSHGSIAGRRRLSEPASWRARYFPRSTSCHPVTR